MHNTLKSVGVQGMLRIEIAWNNENRSVDFRTPYPWMERNSSTLNRSINSRINSPTCVTALKRVSRTEYRRRTVSTRCGLLMPFLNQRRREKRLICKEYRKMEETKTLSPGEKIPKRRKLPVIDCDVHNTLVFRDAVVSVPLRALASASSDVGRT